MPVHLSIPSIGVDARVLPVGDPGGVLTPPTDIGEIGWWDGGPEPGGAGQGSVALVGHVDGRNAAGVPREGALFNLARVPLGARAEVTTAGGRTFAYVLRARRIYEKQAVPFARIFARSGVSRLVILTCGGPFDATTRHYLDNVVAYFSPA